MPPQAFATVDTIKIVQVVMINFFIFEFPFLGEFGVKKSPKSSATGSWKLFSGIVRHIRLKEKSLKTYFDAFQPLPEGFNHPFFRDTTNEVSTPQSFY